MKKEIIDKILKLPWIRDEIERREIELVDKTIEYYKERIRRNNTSKESKKSAKSAKNS
jgi:hypothetical protein